MSTRTKPSAEYPLADVAVRLGLPANASALQVDGAITARKAMRYERLVDAAVADGRIAVSSRQGWLESLGRRGATAEADLAGRKPLKAAASKPSVDPVSVAAATEQAIIADISASFGVAHQQAPELSTHEAIMAGFGVEPRS